MKPYYLPKRLSTERATLIKLTLYCQWSGSVDGVKRSVCIKKSSSVCDNLVIGRPNPESALEGVESMIELVCTCLVAVFSAVRSKRAQFLFTDMSGSVTIVERSEGSVITTSSTATGKIVKAIDLTICVSSKGFNRIAFKGVSISMSVGVLTPPEITCGITPDIVIEVEIIEGERWGNN